MDPRPILVTDLDGTLLGDDAALARFRDWLASRRTEHRLVYASGRHLGSIRRLIDDDVLPDPDAIVSAVGTEIHDGSGQAWPGWLDGLRGWSGDLAREALGALSWLTLQPDEHQSPLKASYDARDMTSWRYAALRRRLEEAGLSAGFVYSGGSYLDVIPSLAGKGEATRFLARRWSVADGDVLAFGDSGNDLQLLRSGFRGTIVANALPELRNAVSDRVYRSPMAFADGVLDGVRHWSSVRAPGRAPSRSRRVFDRAPATAPVGRWPVLARSGSDAQP